MTTFSDDLKRLLDAGIHPVRGGSEAPGATEGDTVTIDGEEFSKSELADFKNNQDWRRSNEQRSAELKRQEADMASQRDRINEEGRLNAAREADRLEQNRKLREKQEEGDQIDLSGMPNESEEPEAYRQELQSRLRQTLAKGQEKAAAEYDRKLQATVRATEGRMTQQNGQQRAYAANEQTVKDYFADMEGEGTPVDDATQKRIMGHMNKTLRTEGHGEVDASGVFRFNREAVSNADYAIRREFWRNRDRESGFQDGLTQRRKNGETSSSPRFTQPGENATATQLWEIGSQLPAESAEREAFFDSLSDDQLTAYITEDKDQRLASGLGGEYI